MPRHSRFLAPSLAALAVVVCWGAPHAVSAAPAAPPDVAQVAEFLRARVEPFRFTRSAERSVIEAGKLANVREESVRVRDVVVQKRRLTFVLETIAKQTNFDIGPDGKDVLPGRIVADSVSSLEVTLLQLHSTGEIRGTAVASISGASQGVVLRLEGEALTMEMRSVGYEDGYSASAPSGFKPAHLVSSTTWKPAADGLTSMTKILEGYEYDVATGRVGERYAKIELTLHASPLPKTPW